MSNISAKEMFEKLGFKLVTKNEREIIYSNEGVCIGFYPPYKCVECFEKEFSCSFTFEELQAINKQVEELKWDAEN